MSLHVQLRQEDCDVHAEHASAAEVFADTDSVIVSLEELAILQDWVLNQTGFCSAVRAGVVGCI